jgi:hypothetical protein
VNIAADAGVGAPATVYHDTARYGRRAQHGISARSSGSPADAGDLSELARFFARAAKLGRHVIGGGD